MRSDVREGVFHVLCLHLEGAGVYGSCSVHQLQQARPNERTKVVKKCKSRCTCVPSLTRGLGWAQHRVQTRGRRYSGPVLGRHHCR